MARVKLITQKEDVDPKDYELFDELVTRRGRVSGPSTVVLHSPTLAGPWNEISEFLQGKSIVPARRAELAVCTTARELDCGYIWGAHVPRARNAGVPEATLDAVRAHAAVDGIDAGDAQIVSFVRQVLRENRVEPALFAALLEAYGAQTVVELTSWVGRYSALAGIVNAFEVEPAADADPLPARPSQSKQAPGDARPYGGSPRLTPISARDQVDEATRPLFDEVGESRGNVRGPWTMVMYSPGLARVLFDVATYLRTDRVCSAHERELATLAVARERDCDYVWGAHTPAARKEGIDEGTISGVEKNAALAALPATERDVVDYTRQLLRSHRVEQALFDRLRSVHGVPWLVELTATIGSYGFICCILNATEVSAAPGADRLS